MWHWVKRCHDWLMNDQLPLYRLRSQSQGVHVSYEKAGLTLHHGSVPWNAESVLVEARLRLPPQARVKDDFSLRIDEDDPLCPDFLRRAEVEGDYRLLFRLKTPSSSSTIRIFWRDHLLGETHVPVIGQSEYRLSFRLHTPTVIVRIGEHTVAAQTFVSTQCRGLYATAHVSNPNGLAALGDLGLKVHFRNERDGQIENVPITLSSSQLAGKEALIMAVPKRFPRRMGAWTIHWLLGDQVLATRQVRAISQRAFQKSLRTSDTRFVVSPNGKELFVQRQLPTLSEIERVGPCFLISSREAGMAGECKLEVRAHLPGGLQTPELMEQTLLVSDGPTLFAPGTLSRTEAEQISGFELFLNGASLGSLSLRPIPRAAFTTEGGFKPAPDFSWSSLAEEELNDRLNRLLG